MPNGSVRLIEPDFAGRLNGFSLLFKAFNLECRLPPCNVLLVNRRIGCMAVCEKYLRDGLRCGRALGCHSTGH